MATGGLEENKLNRIVDLVVGGILRLLASPVAGAVRAYHLTVGHSTVSAASLIMFAIILVGGGWTVMVYNLNLPREQARLEEIAANTYRMQLDNAKKAAEIQATPTVPWTVLSLAVQDGAEIKFRSDPLAAKLLFQWYTPLNRLSGIQEFDISGTAGEMTTVTIPSEMFGPAWTQDDPATEDYKEGRIIYHAYQILTDGRNIRYTGRHNNVIVVP